MKVKFLPQGQEIEISPEKTLLQAALENGIDIKSICKGKLICAECRVKVVEGEANCLPPTKAELNLIGSAWQLDSLRFACQIRCFGDVTIDLTEQVQREESNRKKIRGYKSNRPAQESRAVIDTMLLTEKIEPGAEPAEGEAPAREDGSRKERGGQRGGQQQGRSGQQQRGGGQQARGGGGQQQRGGGKNPKQGGGGDAARGAKAPGSGEDPSAVNAEGVRSGEPRRGRSRRGRGGGGGNGGGGGPKTPTPKPPTP